MNIDHSIAPGNDLLADSLPGEFVRLLLIGTASFSAIASVARFTADPIDFTLAVGNLVVLACVVTTRFAGSVRGLVLLGLALAVIYLTLQSAQPNRWVAPLVFFYWVCPNSFPHLIYQSFPIPTCDGLATAIFSKEPVNQLSMVTRLVP